MNDIELWQGDCLELMHRIPDGSVDLVLTDPPFGTMKRSGLSPAAQALGFDAFNWDMAVPTLQMFDAIARVLRPNGKCVLFSQEPYTSELITTAIPALPFSYRAIWLKPTAGHPLRCNKAMLGRYEDICLFQKGVMRPPIDFEGKNPLRGYFAEVLHFIGCKTAAEICRRLGHRKAEHCFYVTGDGNGGTQFSLCTKETYRELVEVFGIDKMQGFIEYDELSRINNDFMQQNAERRAEVLREINTRYPYVFNLWDGGKSKSNVLEYAKDRGGYHPTQKPVKLLEDLIRTFSNEGDTVLDFTMGSGSTGVACVNTGRRFIGIELDENYFEIAQRRIAEAEYRK